MFTITDTRGGIFAAYADIESARAAIVGTDFVIEYEPEECAKYRNDALEAMLAANAARYSAQPCAFTVRLAEIESRRVTSFQVMARNEAEAYGIALESRENTHEVTDLYRSQANE